jgi:hypothetical protein
VNLVVWRDRVAAGIGRMNTRPRPCTGFRFAFRQASLSGKEAVKNEFGGEATV